MNLSISKRAAHSSTYPFLAELEAFEHRAIVRRQVPSLMRNGFSLLGEISMNRSIDESELMTFSKLSSEEWFRLHKLLEAHDMLQSVNTPLPTFTKAQEEAELLKAKEEADSQVELEAENMANVVAGGVEEEKGSAEGASDVPDSPVDSLVMNRTLYRKLTASCFSQILMSESIKEPTVLKRYYCHTDELLYLLAWPSPHRRQGASTWSPLDSITTTKALQQLGGNGEKYRLNTLKLNPTGKAVVLAHQFNSTGGAWLSIHLGADTFGLRHVDELANKDRGTKQLFACIRAH